MLNDSNSVTITIDTTTRLDWHSGEFNDEGSCFWSEHAPAREAMHDHSDCGAVRSWKYNNYRERWEGIGRCWYYYDRYKDTIFLFNGYGNTKSQFASALQELFDYPERRHYPYFHANEDDGEHLWNNSGGILLYKPGANIPDGETYELSHLSIEDDGDYFYCNNCECRIPEDEMYVGGYYNYCQDCYYERYVSCCRCGEAEAIDDAITDAGGETWCNACGRRYLTQCEHCEEWVRNDDSVDIERECCVVSFCSEECRDEWERQNPDPEDSSEQ
jgi:hypothetical protein